MITSAGGMGYKKIILKYITRVTHPEELSRHKELGMKISPYPNDHGAVTI